MINSAVAGGHYLCKSNSAALSHRCSQIHTFISVFFHMISGFDSAVFPVDTMCSCVVGDGHFEGVVLQVAVVVSLIAVF